jgi:hypothetical protein
MVCLYISTIVLYLMDKLDASPSFLVQEHEEVPPI